MHCPPVANHQHSHTRQLPHVVAWHTRQLPPGHTRGSGSHTDTCRSAARWRRDPERGWDRSRVKGPVAKLVHVKEPSAATALEVAAGGRLYQVCEGGGWVGAGGGGGEVSMQQEAGRAGHHAPAWPRLRAAARQQAGVQRPGCL